MASLGLASSWLTTAWMGTTCDWLTGLLTGLLTKALSSGPFTEDPEHCLVSAAGAAPGESNAASVNLGRLPAEGEKAACGFMPCGASRSTGDISLITFSLEASRTSACLIADSADSESTGVMQSQSDTATPPWPEAMGLLLPADSILAVTRALAGNGSGLDAAIDSGLAKPASAIAGPLEPITLLGVAAAITGSDDESGIDCIPEVR